MNVRQQTLAIHGTQFRSVPDSQTSVPGRAAIVGLGQNRKRRQHAYAERKTPNPVIKCILQATLVMYACARAVADLRNAASHLIWFGCPVILAKIFRLTRRANQS